MNWDPLTILGGAFLGGVFGDEASAELPGFTDIFLLLTMW